ncbi:YdeI family protein [Chloroflexota bacterium]
MEIDKALLFSNSKQWRKWLEQNHDTIKDVWLIHYKKNSNKSSVSYQDALEEALCFGWIDSIMKSIDDEKFILKYSPRKTKSIWSKLNKEKAEKLIKAGKMTDAGLIKIEEAKNNGFWDNAYTNKDRDEIPEDLNNALLQNKDALENFHNFANSYWNMYIGWVNSAKTEQTRKRRIAEVVERSWLNKKPGIV